MMRDYLNIGVLGLMSGADIIRLVDDGLPDNYIQTAIKSPSAEQVEARKMAAVAKREMRWTKRKGKGTKK